MKNIIFTGGGSAGHITPNLAIIDEIKNYNIFYLGGNGIEKEIISKYKNINYIEIPTVKLVRSFTLKNLLIPIKLIKSIHKTKKIIKRINPSLIFSKGGFVSLPVCIAGQILKIPTITHESDITIGLANKIIAIKSKAILCSFKKTADNYGKNAIFTGSPIRKKILLGNKNNIKDKINFDNNKKTIMIVGGSLGAKPINKIIFSNIKKLVKNYNIIHIVGKNNIDKKINEKNYIQLEFVNNIEDYYDASNIVISRAGSNTIFELLAFSKPMILIPLPKGNSRGDQELNAKNFKENNLAEIINQKDLNITNLVSKIEYMLKNEDKIINNLKEKNKNLGNDKILNIINKYTK